MDVVFQKTFLRFTLFGPKQTKEMEELIKKEKLLHKEIRADFQKISQKINGDFEKASHLKSDE